MRHPRPSQGCGGDPLGWFQSISISQQNQAHWNAKGREAGLVHSKGAGRGRPSPGVADGRGATSVHTKRGGAAPYPPVSFAIKLQAKVSPGHANGRRPSRSILVRGPRGEYARCPPFLHPRTYWVCRPGFARYPPDCYPKNQSYVSHVPPSPCFMYPIHIGTK